MFDIGLFELLICLAVGLLIIGPEKLPQLLRQIGIFKRKVSSNLYQIKWQLEQEITPADVKRIKDQPKPAKQTSVPTHDTKSDD